MKNLAFLSLALIFAAPEICAQDGWKPGVVIHTNGDTLNGRLSVNSMSLFECRLMSANGNSVKYEPNDVTAFYIPGEIYFERGAIKVNNEERSVFMNVLVIGQADLLGHKSSFYLRDPGGNIIPLETITNTRKIEGKEYVATVEMYKQKLTEKFTDCPEAQVHVKRTALTKNSLSKLFNKYNACFSPGNEAVVPKNLGRPKSRFYAGVEFSVLRTRLSGIDNNYTRMKETTFDDDYSQNFPGFYLKLSPRQIPALSVQLSLHRVSYHFKCYDVYDWIRENSTHTGWEHYDAGWGYDFSYSTTVVPLMVQYSFLNSRSVQPFIGIGIASQFNNQFKGYEIYTNVTDGEAPERRPVGGFTAKGTSFLSSAGINFVSGRLLMGGSVQMEYLTSPMGSIRGVGGYFNGKQINIGFTFSLGLLLTK